MKNDMIWASVVHLTGNIWADRNGTERHMIYHEQLPTDDESWKEVIDFLPTQGVNTVVIDLGDGVQYETHPEIAIPGAWSKDKLKNELDRIRALGVTPIPMLNFSAAHDAWMGEYEKMVSTKDYYQVVGDLIGEVCELFDGPELFHLGLNEEMPGAQQKYGHCCARRRDYWWKDIFFMFDCCEKAGARPWMFADNAWRFQEEYLEKMPKSVLQSVPYNSNILLNKNGECEHNHCKAYEALDRAGFEQVLAGSARWAGWYNAYERMRLGKDKLTPELVKGYMCCPWSLTNKSEKYAVMNEVLRFGEGKRHAYPELCPDADQRDPFHICYKWEVPYYED